MADVPEIEALEDIVVDIHRSSHNAYYASASRNVKKYSIKEYEEKLIALSSYYHNIEENCVGFKTQICNYQGLIPSLQKTIQATNLNNCQMKNTVLEQQSSNLELKKNSERVIKQFQQKLKDTLDLYEKSPLAIQRTALNKELNIFEFELILAKKSFNDSLISVQLYKEIKNKLRNILIIDFVNYCKKAEAVYLAVSNLKAMCESKKELYKKLFNDRNNLLQLVETCKKRDPTIEAFKDRKYEVSSVKQHAGILPILNFEHSSIPVLYLPRRDFISNENEVLSDGNESHHFYKSSVKYSFENNEELNKIQDSDLKPTTDQVKESDSNIKAINQFIEVNVKNADDFTEEQLVMVEPKKEKIEIITNVKVQDKEALKFLKHVKQKHSILKKSTEMECEKEFGEIQNIPLEVVDKLNDVKKVTFDEQLILYNYDADGLNKQNNKPVIIKQDIERNKENEHSTPMKRNYEEINKSEDTSQYFNKVMKFDPVTMVVPNQEKEENTEEIETATNMDLHQNETKVEQITKIETEDLKGKETCVLNVAKPILQINKFQESTPAPTPTSKFDISGLMDFGSPLSSDCGDVNYSNYSNLLSSLRLSESPTNLDDSRQSNLVSPSPEPAIAVKHNNMFGFGFETFTANRYKFFNNKGADKTQKSENDQKFKDGHMFSF